MTVPPLCFAVAFEFVGLVSGDKTTLMIGVALALGTIIMGVCGLLKWGQE